MATPIEAGLELLDHGTRDIMFYGEPGTENDFLCPLHGCRLTRQPFIGFQCPECQAEDAAAESEERLLAMEQMEAEQDTGGSCTLITGQGFNAFHCVMPWWA